MTFLDIDWQDIFPALERYRSLSQGARLYFLNRVKPSQAIPNSDLGAWRQPLLDSGLMVSGVKGVNASVKSEFRIFHRVIRAVGRHRILESASRYDFHNFIREHFEDSEISGICGTKGGYGYYYDYEKQRTLFLRVCSSRWVKQFLDAKSVDWEEPYQARGARPYLASAEVLNAAQWLIRCLVKEGTPVPLVRLPELMSPLSLALLSSAIRAATRYLMVFPSLAGDDLEPVLGLWPRLAGKLSRPPARAPQPVTVDQEFSSPILMEDMITILMACATTPLRIRSNDDEIFEADQRELQAAMGLLPSWVESQFQLEQSRTSAARVRLLRHNFAEIKSDRGRSLHIAKDGAHWLDLSAKARLKLLIDDYQKPQYRNQLGSFPDAIMAAFAGLKQEGFVRLSDFLAFNVAAENPLIALSHQNSYGQHWTGSGYASEQTEEELEDAWNRMLTNFLRQQLMPLGGVKLGRDSGGATCFALTPAGNYLLGTAPDFHLSDEAPGHIVVQPNFDIVFLAPSRKAEIEIARFGERKGRNVGTMFKVTKASIQAAAASGLTPERVMQILHEHCNGAVPRNVETEITGWFRQYRQIGFRQTTVVQCPDSETATQVLAAAGRNAVRLSDTVLEWSGGKISPSLQKKLRTMGIFVKG
jgi:hypothetical protein